MSAPILELVAARDPGQVVGEMGSSVVTILGVVDRLAKCSQRGQADVGDP